jgi:hypothetical protein
MGIVYPGVPRYLAEFVARELGIRTFVETGTYLGRTAKWAKRHFEHVVTIEAARALYDRVQPRLAAGGIDARFGSSENVLPEVVARLSGPALFWLDGHWSGGATFGEASQCPIMEELEAVLRHSPEHLIFIDDARLFLAPPPPPCDEQQWPSIFVIREHVNKISPTSWIGTFDDIIVVVPTALKSRILAAHHRAVDEREGVVRKFVYKSPLLKWARSIKSAYMGV